MSEKYCISIYKGEGRILILPQIRHMAGFSVYSEEYVIIDDCDDFESIGRAIIDAKKVIDNSPLAMTKPSDSVVPWKLNSRFKTQMTFWKNNNCSFFKFYGNDEMEVYSAEKVCRGGYGGCIKEIKIQKDASVQDIGRAVIEVFQAAEEFYKMNKK